MNYQTHVHTLFKNYLEAVDQSLAAAHIPIKVREEISENLIAQFENALASTLPFDEAAYVAQLDDPRSYAANFAEENSVGQSLPETGKRLGQVVKWFCFVLVAGLLLAAATYFVKLRNEVVIAETGVDAAWAQVETALQRRYDLIPNIVNTVKGFATHERELLERVTMLRSQWGEAKDPEQRLTVAAKLEGVLTKVVALSEQYPSLASSEHFLALQFQLEGTENRIAVARVRYNEALQYYNAAVRQFPANLLGFRENAGFFKADPEAQQAVRVDFKL